MRSTQDPIQGLKQKILDWGIVSEEDIKALEKQAKQLVDKEVKEAEEAPFPESSPGNLFEDIYVPGSEPEFMKGRTLEETYVCSFFLYRVQYVRGADSDNRHYYSKKA